MLACTVPWAQLLGPPGQAEAAEAPALRVETNRRYWPQAGSPTRLTSAQPNEPSRNFATTSEPVFQRAYTAASAQTGVRRLLCVCKCGLVSSGFA